jgi:carboxylesterase type B
MITTYLFRNIPYAEHSVAEQNRFKLSEVRTTPYTQPGQQPFDATRTGPLCQQGTLTNYTDIFDSTLEDFLISALPDSLEGFVPHAVVAALLTTIEILVEVPLGTLDPAKKLKDVAHDFLDVDFSVAEDCLHLAVSSPILPNGVARPQLPVMFYIHGGGFSSGFQIKMGPERLMAFGDVVVVAINYRINALGFLCFDSDESPGNMGMLDMVTALKWVHNNIQYFGGDPNQITIFGESAGSATIGHLMFSDTTNSLFARGIGSSGSPLASWAFDHASDKSSKEVAEIAGCTQDDTEEIIACLRNLDAAEISAAHGRYQSKERFEARLGFGASSPCAQSKGAVKFYTKDQNPASILSSGNYSSVPIFFGANKKEGSYVYTVLYNEYFKPNGLLDDSDFLTYDTVAKLMEAVEVSNYYGFKEHIKNDYFDPGQIGDLYSMIPGLQDVMSVFFFKANAYEMVIQNSKHSPSYWYAFDYSNTDKSLFHLQYMDPATKAMLTHPGTSHGDESMYLFNVEIPLVWCDIGQIAQDALECLTHLDAVFCLTLPNGAFRSRWHDCLTGELNEEEAAVSASIAQLWTNFAIYGEPGFGLKAWDRTDPTYVKIDSQVSLQTDYTKEYHIALEEFRDGALP